MTRIDWSVLSGPRVSRRTLMGVALASGAMGYARQLGGAAADPPPRRSTRRLSQSEPKQGGTLKLGFGISQIPNLDPAKVNLGIVAGEIVSNIFSSLVQFDPELGLIPDLAETWKVSDDGLQYGFTLRDGLTFHNGDSLTANDLVYTYERNINPDFASPHANKLALITAAEAPDDLTFNVTLSAPFAPFLAVACSRGPGRALTPISKRAFEELGEEQFDQTPVGCGPFALVAETADLSSGFELVAFDGWYGGRPLPGQDRGHDHRRALQPHQRPGSRRRRYARYRPAPLAWRNLSTIPISPWCSCPGTNWIGLAMNYEREPWANLDARMAVAKAIDRRRRSCRPRSSACGTPGIGPIAPAFGWAYLPPEDTETPQAFDVDAAKALAEKAGIVGAQPAIMGTADNQRVAEVLRGQLADIGVDVQFELLQQAAWNERWTAGDFDWIINGSVVDADPDDGHWNFFHSEGPWNTFKYSNPDVDQLLLDTRETGVQEERAQQFQEIQKLLQADVAYAFLHHTLDVTGFGSDVQGYNPIPEMRYLESVWLDR